MGHHSRTSLWCSLDIHELQKNTVHQNVAPRRTREQSTLMRRKMHKCAEKPDTDLQTFSDVRMSVGHVPADGALPVAVLARWAAPGGQVAVKAGDCETLPAFLAAQRRPWLHCRRDDLRLCFAPEVPLHGQLAQRDPLGLALALDESYTLCLTKSTCRRSPTSNHLHRGSVRSRPRRNETQYEQYWAVARKKLRSACSYTLCLTHSTCRRTPRPATCKARRLTADQAYES